MGEHGRARQRAARACEGGVRIRMRMRARACILSCACACPRASGARTLVARGTEVRQIVGEGFHFIAEGLTPLLCFNPSDCLIVQREGNLGGGGQAAHSGPEVQRDSATRAARCARTGCGLGQWTRAADSGSGLGLRTRAADSGCGLGLWTRAADSGCGLGLWTRAVGPARLWARPGCGPGAHLVLDRGNPSLVRLELRPAL